MSFLQDIRDTIVIEGESDIDYYNDKWKRVNLFYKMMSQLRQNITPTDIYNFFYIDIDIIEGFYSFQKYKHYLIPRKNKYFLNPVKFNCSCPYFKFKKICKHLNKYKELYNLSLILMNKLGYSESRDIMYNIIY